MKQDSSIQVVREIMDEFAGGTGIGNDFVGKFRRVRYFVDQLRNCCAQPGFQRLRNLAVQIVMRFCHHVLTCCEQIYRLPYLQSNLK